MSDRLFEIGDDIEVKDKVLPLYGRVIEVNFRTTRIKMKNGAIISISNSYIAERPIETTQRKSIRKKK